MIFQDGALSETSGHSDARGRRPRIGDGDDGPRIAFDDQQVRGAVWNLVNALFEAQVLVTPDDVGDVTPDRQLTDIFGVVGEPVAQFADVEQILDEDGRRSIDGKGQGVRSR